MEKHTSNVAPITPLHQTQLFDRSSQPAVTIELLLLQVIQLLQSQHQAPVEVPVTQATASEPETMDVQEVATYLRISAWTVRDMVRTKSIPFFRIRSRIFFRKRELDQWLYSQRQETR